MPKIALFFLTLFTLHLTIFTTADATEIRINKTTKLLKYESNFVRNSTKEVIIDKDRNLMWQDNRAAKDTKRDWYGAKLYCQNLDFAGYSDWYLPSLSKLLTIRSENIYNFAYGYYWSSSEDKSYRGSAWNVHFKYGGSYGNNKGDKNYVRCIRKGKLDILTFDTLVKNLLLKKITKDMFESNSEFSTRMLKAKLSTVKEALEIFYGKPILHNLQYDANNGYFITELSFEAKKDFRQKMVINISRAEAREFYKAQEHLKPVAVFDYDGSSISLKSVEIPFKKKSYLAQFTDQRIDSSRVAINYGVDIISNKPENFKSFDDLDRLLTKANVVKPSKKRWLFVIGIERYEYNENIAYARRSAEMFVKTAQKVLGVLKQNSYVMIDSKASQARIKTNLKKMLRRVQMGDTIYFYYNGHGIPIPSQKNRPYLLAYDSEADFIQDESFFSLQNIYSRLSNSKASKIVAIVDSCFSGMTDGKALLKGVAATRVIPKRTSFNKEKMVVISAGKGYQYSNAYNKKGHRLFSFFVMKNILEGNKEIKTLYKDVKAQTYDTSFKEYGDLRLQEPTIEGNSRMKL